MRERTEAALRSIFMAKWVQVYEHESSSFYAAQILHRKKATRLFTAWLHVASSRRRAELQVLDVEACRRRDLLLRAIMDWTRHVRLRNLAEDYFLERRQQWSSALFRSWSTEAQRAASLREALRLLHAFAKSATGRRAAKLRYVAAMASLQRACLQVLAAWTSRARLLRARCQHLAAETAADRQRRRLCCWVVRARDQVRSTQAMEVGFRLWVDIHHKELARARGLTSIAARCTVRLLGAALAPWVSFAQHGRDMRKATWTLHRRWKKKCGSRGLDALYRWGQSRRIRRCSLQGHHARWAARRLQSCIAGWRRLAHFAHLAACHASSRVGRTVQVCLSVWSVQAKASVASAERSLALYRQRELRRTTASVLAWFQLARRWCASRRIVHILEQAERRWVDRQQWVSRAASDTAFHAMLRRFTTAFELRRSELSPRGGKRQCLLQDGTSEALLSFIWERQQLAATFGRLSGRQAQPWLLGMWPAGPLPFLAPGTACFVQAETRLATTVSKLEAERSSDRAVSMYMQSCSAMRRRHTGRQQGEDEDHPPPQHQALMWQALADMMVVYHPRWAAAGDPGMASGGTVGASCGRRHVPDSDLPRFGRQTVAVSEPTAMEPLAAPVSW